MATATKRCTFDGMTDGTALTTVGQTSTSGDQISSLSGGAGNTKTAKASAAVRGGIGLELVGTAVSSFVSFTDAGTAGGCELYLNHDSTATVPTIDVTILAVRNSGGGMVGASALSTGIIRITNAAGGTVANLNGNVALPTGKYRLFIAAAKGTTTSNGRIVYELRNAVTHAVIDSADTGATVNAGTTDVTEFRYGKTGPTGNMTMRMDEVAYRIGDVSVIDYIQSPVTATFASTWAVRAPVTATFASTWAVRAPVTATFSSTWAVRAAVTATSSSTWAVRAQITVTSASTWVVRQAVVAAWPSTWNVESISSVIASFPSTWAVRQAVTAAASSTWAVRQAVAAEWPSGWAVRVAATQIAPSTWAVRAAVTTESGSTWAVLAAVIVNSDSSWAVRQAVVATYSSTWRVAGEAVQPGDVVGGVTYDRGPVGAVTYDAGPVGGVTYP